MKTLQAYYVMYYTTSTGVGLYSTETGQLQNNSIVVASSTNRIQPIWCASGTLVPNVGQLIAPSGQNVTTLNTDNLEVATGGPENPGFLSVKVLAGTSLSTLDIGVYSCMIPDESGEQQVLHFGLYLNGFNSKLP